MAKNSSQALNRQHTPRLTRYLLLFFVVMAALGLFLAKQAYDQLQWEAFHRFQIQAQELSERLERNITNLLEQENQRGFSDYSFTVASGTEVSAYVQLSPLAATESSSIPGFLGYFQLDDRNRFSTPLLPDGHEDPKEFGFSEADIRQREQIQSNLREILLRNQLLVESQQRNVLELLERNTRLAEDRQKVAQTQSLEKYQLQDLRKKAEKKAFFKDEQQESDDAFATAKPARTAPSANELKPAPRVQKELVAEVENESAVQLMDESSFAQAPLVQRSLEDQSQQVVEPPREFSFLESRIEAFSSANLESGHLLFYRHIWQQQQHYIQGFILERQSLIEKLIVDEFRSSALATMSSVALVWQNQVQHIASAKQRGYNSRQAELSGSILYKHAMSEPLGDWDLLFTIDRLPAGPGLKVLLLSSLTYLLVLALACVFIYRFLGKQIAFAQQQQNFVSSISHELKTPLTSIRMYGEMLREGWVNEDKKREYYNFIFYESERLTRLINNILQMARMTRSELPVNLKAMGVAELFDLLRSTLADQVTRAGFELNLQNTCETEEIAVDPDLILQVLINLVDNALKFSRNAERKRVDIIAGCRPVRKGKPNELEIQVRDYGPGIDAKQEKHIFNLFYRAENELTRETRGTGIGLALVRDLLRLMHASIRVESAQPGANFILTFPLFEGSALTAPPKKV